MLPVQLINTCQFTFPTLAIFGLLFYWKIKKKEREKGERERRLKEKKKTLVFISSDEKNARLMLIQILNLFQTSPHFFPSFKDFYAF